MSSEKLAQCSSSPSTPGLSPSTPSLSPSPCALGRASKMRFAFVKAWGLELEILCQKKAAEGMRDQQWKSGEVT